MMTADSLRFIVPSGVSIHWPSPRRCACSASADPTYRAPHLALPSHVQTSCLEHARPTAIGVFPSALAASSTAPPGRRRPERQRKAKAEGKIKGRGTSLREKPVCTWGWRGTRRVAAPCCVATQSLVSLEPSACFSRSATLTLDRGAP